jgi:putative transposase
MRFAPQETRTYFVTAITAERRSLFQVAATAELLQQTILDYRSKGKFLLHAFVIMPEHQWCPAKIGPLAVRITYCMG